MSSGQIETMVPSIPSAQNATCPVLGVPVAAGTPVADSIQIGSQDRQTLASIRSLAFIAVFYLYVGTL